MFGFAVNWELLLPGLIEAAADLLLHALGQQKAQEKLVERAAILAARYAADLEAAKKFAANPQP